MIVGPKEGAATLNHANQESHGIIARIIARRVETRVLDMSVVKTPTFHKINNFPLRRQSRYTTLRRHCAAEASRDVTGYGRSGSIIDCAIGANFDYPQ